MFLLLGLSACASTNVAKNGPSNIPATINYAPAIDVPYEEVKEDINQHLGVNVRWGGQIIASEQINDGHRLTVITYPLNDDGRPDRKKSKDFEAGRFIVETTDFDSEKSSRFVTVFGPVSGQQLLQNGKLETTVPVVTAQETQEWNAADRRYVVRTGRHLPYNGLAHSRSYGRFYSDGYYGRGFGFRSSFNSGFHPGFRSSFRGGFGFSPYSYYPHSFYNGFRGSRFGFGRGFRSSRFGRHW